MRTPNRWLGPTIAGVLGGLLATGCKADLPPLLFETAHFRYHSRADVDVCEDGLGDWLEHHYDSVGGALGATLPEGDKFDVYTYSGLDDLQANGCRGFDVEVAGCAGNRKIHQSAPWISHEFVHAYAGLVGDAPPVFEEGLAQVLGCGEGAGSELLVRSAADMASALSKKGYDDLGPRKHTEVTWAAGGFVRFLIDRDGLDRFLQLYTLVDDRDNTEEVEAAIVQVYSDRASALLDAWVAGPEQSEADVCMYIAECATPAATPAPETTTASCTYTPSVVGTDPYAVIRSVTAEGPTGIALAADFPESVVMAVERCDGVGSPMGGWPGDGDGTHTELWADVPAGEYWVRLSAHGPFQATVEAGPSWFAETCDAAVPRPIGPDTANVTLAGRTVDARDDDPVDGAGDLAVSFTLSENRGSRVWRSRGEAWLCPGVCPSSQPSTCDGNEFSPSFDAGTVHTVVLQEELDAFTVRVEFYDP